jgi:hypothetical protein
MLEFNEFRDYVEVTLPEVLPEKLQGVKIEQHDVQKNNGLVLHSITVKPEDSNVAPNIYMDSFYERYKDGASVDDLMEEIKETVVKHLDAPEEFQNVAQDFKNFDVIKDKIVMVAVNTERNAKLLSEVPHKDKEDLSLIYKVMVGNNIDGIATITIRNEHMDFWGVTVDQLHELAMANTKEILPVTVKSMNEVMREIFAKDGMDEDMMNVMFEDMPANKQMYVISNKSNVNGAASMFYEDALSGLAEKLGTDLYILPSSVHEVIAVSSEMGTPEELSNMVREVNGSQVSPEERLSDHVYKFEAATKKLSLADTSVEELKKAAGAENVAVDAPTEGARPHKKSR